MLSGTGIRGSNPIWFVNDIDGCTLTPADYASFLSNTFPYITQNVFQDPEMTIPWGQPIQFDASGALPDNIYFNPSLIYRIEFRAGPTQFDALVRQPIENYDPGDAGSADDEVSTDTENQITNPQFIYTLMGTNTAGMNSATYTTAGTYNFAPGWFLKLVGTTAGSTTTLTQMAYASNEAYPEGVANPPYVLRVASSGWTQVILYQQFQNGALFANLGASVSFIARSIANQQPLSVNYVDNAGNNVPIVQEQTATTDWNTFASQAVIPASMNSAVAPTGYVQLQFVLPPTGTIEISNVQFFGSDVAVTLPYQQTTPERQEDHLFHYFAESLIIHPKASLLVGWNFSENPFQFNPTTPTVAGAQCQYIADQTILYSKGAAGSLTTGQAGVGQNSYLKIYPPSGSTTSTQFAIIQYVEPKTVQQYWQSTVSSLVRAAIDSAVGTKVQIKLRLIYRPSLPPSMATTPPISSWTGIDPVFESGWTVVLTPMNDPTYTLNSVTDASGFGYASFDNMVLPTQVSANDTLGIVVYTISEISTAGAPDAILFKNISLVPNRFAMESQPETFDETFRKCQYFYEKSYPYNILAGSLSYPGVITLQQAVLPYTISGATFIGMQYRSFSMRFKETKRSIPSVTFYSPSVAGNGKLDGFLTLNGVIQGTVDHPLTGTFPTGVLSIDGFTCLVPTTDTFATGPSAAQNTTPEALLQFQYSADSRIGV